MKIHETFWFVQTLREKDSGHPLGSYPQTLEDQSYANRHSRSCERAQLVEKLFPSGVVSSSLKIRAESKA